MKKVIFLLSIILVPLMFSSCHKDNSDITYTDQGQIVGHDPRLCPSPCCGGWIIDINYKSYRFFALPENSNIELSFDSLPINVLVTWKKYDKPCAGDEITIIQITKID